MAFFCANIVTEFKSVCANFINFFNTIYIQDIHHNICQFFSAFLLISQPNLNPFVQILYVSSIRYIRGIHKQFIFICLFRNAFANNIEIVYSLILCRKFDIFLNQIYTSQAFKILDSIQDALVFVYKF